VFLSVSAALTSLMNQRSTLANFARAIIIRAVTYCWWGVVGVGAVAGPLPSMAVLASAFQIGAHVFLRGAQRARLVRA
jgi:hypothetical protein